MIIVEGLDNTGKTTLVKELLAWFPQLRLQEKSPGPVAGHDLARYMKRYLYLQPEETVNMVFDRFPIISEDVYGVILRGKKAVDKKTWEALADLFLYHIPLIIYCQVPMKVIEETFDEREQMKGVKEHLQELYARYDTVMQNWRKRGVQVVTYDWTRQYREIESTTRKHLWDEVDRYLRRDRNEYQRCEEHSDTER